MVEVESSLDAVSLSGLSGQAQIMGDALVAEINRGPQHEMLDDLSALSLASDSIGIESVLAGLSPEIYAGAPVAAIFQQERLLISALQNRFRSSNEPGKGARTLWGGVGASTSQLDGENGFSGVVINASGFEIGGDYQVTDELALGFVTALSYADVSFDNLIAGFEGVGYSFGGYGLYDLGAFDLGGFVTYGASEYDADRAVGNVVALTAADASIDVSSIHAYAEISKEFDLRRGLKFRPYVAYDFLHVKRDAFIENSSTSFALNVLEETEVASVIDVGAMLSQSYLTFFGMRMDAYAGAGYRRDVGDHDAVATASFIRRQRRGFFLQ